MLGDYEKFISGIKKITGINLALYKEAQMKRRLQSLYEKKDIGTFRSFYWRWKRTVLC